MKVIQPKVLHCEKYRNFTKILWKGTANRPKLCGNCAFPQNFHTRKLGEITVFYDVIDVQQGPKYTSAFEERTEAATGDVLEK